MFYPLMLLVLSFCLSFTTCQQSNSDLIQRSPLPGAYDLTAYLSKLKGKQVGLVVNQTSYVGERHLLDTLSALGITTRAVFAPEHGFRGEASAGAHIDDNKDPKTGVQIYSIYGKSKKPSAQQLNGIDVMVFDIQDVGARFYTYIATLEYVMEACAEENIPVIILDRPNPNGHYVDGPILEEKYQSFVGRHAIPIVHGLTVGEYGKMLNGEGWLQNGIQCELTVVKCLNYSRADPYMLPIKPSPNLPNQRAIYLYPSLCLLEGTKASLGRGTTKQFQVILHPDYPDKGFSDTPVKRPGAQWPKHENILCYGVDMSEESLTDFERPSEINLNYLIDFYTALGRPKDFFLENNFIDKLAGTAGLRSDIIEGKTSEEIKAGWKEGLDTYLIQRQPYLIYP